MSEDTPQKNYGPFELLDAYGQPAPDTFVLRRQVAEVMRSLSEQLVRIDCTDDELGEWSKQLEAVLAQVRGHERRDTRAANKKLFTGQASATDVFDMMDYEPMSGRANPVSPELLWQSVSKEGVEAHVTLGLQYQGPPGRVHGGVLSWLMDAVLSRAMHASMRIGVTGTLTLRYMASTPIETPLVCRAHIERSEGRKLFIHGGVYHGDTQTVAAEGIFIQPTFAAS